MAKQFLLTRTVERYFCRYRNREVTSDYTHVRPLSLSWRQGISEDRAKQLFGVVLGPNEKAIVTVKVRRICAKRSKVRGEG